MGSSGEVTYYGRKPAFFYGWYIVGVGFLSHLVCAFHLSSTLSVFLKPLTEILGVSRGVFSLLRSGEYLIIAALAPMVGVLLDRRGARWMMAGGAMTAGAGLILLSLVAEFWQFVLIRWFLVTLGGAFLCHMVVNVTISRWFVRKRGRAIAIANLGQGISKVAIPLVAASLFVLIGWRNTWVVFGVLTVALVVLPAVFLIRQRPEDMGLKPDGPAVPCSMAPAKDPSPRLSSKRDPAFGADLSWSRREVLRTKSFWLITVTFSVTDIGIAGLNLHVFAYVTDIGYSAMIAATVMSVIAFTQLGSTLFWGFLSERVDVRRATMFKFLVQAIGLGFAIATRDLAFIYIGFFLYGIGLGGSQVLQEVIWANYYGRLSLGTVRGLSVPVALIVASVGPPFFGFLFDATQSYFVSFVLFTLALMVSAYLILLVRPPQK